MITENRRQSVSIVYNGKKLRQNIIFNFANL